MPSPLLIPAIAAGASILGTGINAYSQGRTNRASRLWNQKMYDWQRRDSLSDWAMQNEYNHPSSVMARLREAGLNPNLVYGEGANMPSVAMRSSDTGSWNPKPVDVQLGGITSGVMSYFDAQIKQAQIDNLRVQNTVMSQDALLKAAQVISTTATGESTKFDLGLKQELKETSIEAAKAGVEKTYADIKSTLDENERRQAMNSPNLQIAAETVLNMRLARAKTNVEIQQIKQKMEEVKRDIRIKDLDIKLKEVGIQPGDALWQRILGRLVGETGGLKEKIVDPIVEKIKDVPKFYWPWNNPRFKKKKK